MSWTAYESTRRSPARNLALEDALLENRDRKVSILLVYRNDPCVVVGRNQNPWREALAGAGFPVFRRRSGGGTVYHDGGNLNWSFMVDRDAWVVEDALDFVVAALRRLGAEPARDPRGALFLEGRKICGTARRYFGPSVLIHGTLLVSSDLEALRTSLAGIPSAEDRAVASVPSPVRNLSETLPGLTVDSVRDALIEELEAREGPVDLEDPERILPESAWSDREREHASWDWVYGGTLPFLVSLGPGGEGPFLRVREGRAEDLEIRRNDGGEPGRAGDTPDLLLPEAWVGRPFDPDLLESLRAWVNRNYAPEPAPGGTSPGRHRA